MLVKGMFGGGIKGMFGMFMNVLDAVTPLVDADHVIASLVRERSHWSNGWIRYFDRYENPLPCNTVALRH